VAYPGDKKGKSIGDTRDNRMESGGRKMSAEKKLIANPMLVLREEFDDWAVLFDPDTGDGYGMNPVSVCIWKCLDGNHSFADIVSKVKQEFENTPEKIEQDVREFLDELENKGYAGTEIKKI